MPPPAPRTYWVGAEVVRVMSAIGVIWIHGSTAALSSMATFAVPCFTCLAATFAARAAMKRDAPKISSYLSQRVVRIALPFTLWSLLYATFHQVMGDPYQGLRSLLRPGALIRGGEYHLWYLPFLFVATALVFAFCLWLKKLPNPLEKIVIGIVLVFAVLLYMTAPHTEDGGGGFGGFYRWVFTFPWAMLGAAIGWYLMNQPPWRSTCIACIALGVAVAADAFALDFPAITVVVTSALIGFAFLYASNRFADTITYLGTLSYGVYLIHVLFLELLKRFPTASFERPTTLASIERTVIVTLASFLATSLMMQNRWTRRLIT